MQEEEREPIGSNIYDAINFMRKELERRQALIDDSMFSFLKDLPPLFVHPLVVGFCVFIVLIVCLLTSGIAALVIGVIGVIFSFTLVDLLDNFTFHLKARKTLTTFLPDLVRLSETDNNMDVGFALNSRGWFDEDVLKAMMKKREKEIRDRAKNTAAR